MKGDFTRFTYDARKHYTRVLKQQGRVDLDADWNEVVEIFTQRDRVEAIDVIGRCGVPLHDDGFRVEATADGAGLTIGPGRIYVDGILCQQEGPDPVAVTEQVDLPGYELPGEDGVYLAYLDVWDRHITYLEDPEIREVALGGPDTTTRTRTVAQVRLLRIADDESLDLHECQPFPADPSTGLLTASATPAGSPTNPCAVPEGAGYTGLENRLYRVEIHDDGRDEDGVPGARPVTFKWSRDNGSVVLPIVEENGIDGDTVTLRRLGFDDVLTVRVGDWVEILGDETELHGRRGTLAQIVPDGIDRADLEVELDRDVSAHDAESHLKMRRWDHHETDDLALIDGALPIPAGAFELEDGVVVEFAAGATYHVGDYWVIPARTREGTVLWPQEGTPPVAVAMPPLGIDHHYCTLALARRTGGVWTDPRDCRPFFPPLTEVGEGGCCIVVEPGEDIQQALDTVVAAGGGCVDLCAGVHRVDGPLWIVDGADVKLHGEGGASVVHFVSGDDFGLGGLIIENGRRVAVEDLFLTSDSVPALISVLHGAELERSRQIALRRLILLNLTPSDGESDLTCGIRLGHAEGVRIDGCRIAAEVGILSLWGNALSAPAALPDGGDGGDDGEEAPAAITLGFEGLDLGTEIRVGNSVSEAGVTITGEPFQWSGGEFTENGFAAVENDGNAGGAGQDLQVNNINLAFDLPAPYAAVRIQFGEFGGNLNLRINGDFRNFENFDEVDGLLIGGVRVGVSFADDEDHGLLRLDAEANDVSDFALGGQELWIDDVIFRGPADVPEPVADYGDGVADLRLRDATVRFRDAGILVARADRWRLEGSDIRPFDEEIWAEVGDRLAEQDEDEEGAPADRRYRQVLAALEQLFASPAAAGGYALLAFRWQRCAIHRSTLGGRHGAQAWWWLRGDARGNDVQAGESGLHAFWLYESDWCDNTIATSDGLAASFAGCCRVRVEGNRLRGPIGLANLPVVEAAAGLEALAAALRRAYGADADADLVAGTLVQETFELLGLLPLAEALQPFLDEQSPTPGVPLAYYLAPGLFERLAAGNPGFLRSLPVIDLSASDNDIACSLQGVDLDGFLPLGSLRVADNRIHTTTGQAIHIETNPLFANGHLTVRLIRSLLVLLIRALENFLEDVDDGSLRDAIEVLHALLVGWQEGAENLFDLDFRVEGNTIRSLRTAIESNLFELAVLTNHITMQERALVSVAPQAAGAVFGSVLDVTGAPMAQASVRAAETELAALTDASGQYRISGLAPGTYTLRATMAGFGVSTSSVTLGSGEQVRVDFTLDRSQGLVAFNRAGFSDRAVGASLALPRAANPEILEVIQALETSPALEPLGVAMREGAHTDPAMYASFLAADPGPLVAADARNLAADAATLIQGQSSDPELRTIAGQLNTALRANDRTQLAAQLTRFIAALQRYTDSQGILLAGIGGRVIENHVVVPADVRRDTEALGGIQVSVNLAYVFALTIIAALLSRFLGGNDDNSTAFDPLLGVTDTLIDNNEIVGGVGHGISVQGVAGQPDFLTDLRIRGNQVRGVGGAGLFINEHALIVGLDVVNNHTSRCGRSEGFTQNKGGILIHTAAVCAVHGNHVLRCGETLDNGSAYGIDFDAIYGLGFTGNEVQANGSQSGTSSDGGVRLTEVYGAATLHHNTIAFNRGLGLSWVNSARDDEPALLPPFLMVAVNTHLRMSRTVDQLVAEEQASVQGNVFKSVADSDFPIFQLLNLREVLFGGNTCFADTRGAPLGEIQQAVRGAISNNQTQTNAEIAIALKKIAAGVVLGNVGNRPIQMQSSAAVQHASNVPPVSS